MNTIHNQLSLTRKPRVHLTYDVETEGATSQKELPFVVGVLGDFSGHSSHDQKPLKDRKFTRVDRDNLDTYMKSLLPGLNLRVKNTLQNDGSEMAVSLTFNSLSDFEPEQLVNQIPALKKLLEARQHLRDLLSKVDRSDKLEALLEETLKEPEKLLLLSKELSNHEKNM